MNNFDEIRPFKDSEVNETLKELRHHPMIKALLHFTFPGKKEDDIHNILDHCHSIRDFQTRVIYYAVKKVLDRSSEGFTTSGFDKLDPDTSYLFISNHRDIILDTSLLNVALYEHNLIMTASAIGNNLVSKPFLLALSRLNRNFLIQRELGPREMLKSSKQVSLYIQKLLAEENRSVWIAQRQGRTKDGDDRTQQGVLKMLALAGGKTHFIEYFRKLKVVPVSISYEYDPTDILKMPELMAKHFDMEYVKTSNEDFNSILKGALGQKKRIHMAVCEGLDKELDKIEHSDEPANKQFQMLAERLDHLIHKNYKLWPSNYIAFDLLYNKQHFRDEYSEKERRQFMRRLERRVEKNNTVARENFLAMYANPVINNLNYGDRKD
ncbi:1-acyl-sn-glycerol-3-phosphate acyltransferase [Ascidiimonas aurantiaca]|uniref:1-acyl-sn-glycerol-3-phosphate acyltransferase n=1 Tax=Ascidiimonas aurantiaca TaxID=1685432 RepID=UPI0030EDF9CE